jgi:hypothetical protein
MTQFETRLTELSRTEHPPAISLLLPRAEPGTDGEKARITLENELAEARARLEDLDARDRDALMAPLETLHEEVRHYGRGTIAAFRNRERFEILRTHTPIDAAVEVSNHFLLKPLVFESAHEVEILLVALTLDNVRVHRVSRDEMTELPLSDNVPRSLEDAVGHEVEHGALQHYGGGRSTTGARFVGRGPGTEQGVFHGHGAGKDDRKDEIRTFVARLAKALSDEPLPDLPIVLAGVDFETSMLRSHFTDPRLVPDALIDMSPDGCTDEELRQAALGAIDHVARQRRREAWNRLAEPERIELVARDLDDVLRAGVQGKIDTLFVRPEASRRGSYDRQALRLALDDRGPEDLYNTAVCLSLQHGGRAYPMPEGEDAELLALLRFT